MNPEQASRSVTAAAQQMQARADEASDLLKAMANPQRLRVLCLLVEGEKSVGEINAAIDLSQSALSQHLAVLREQSLVKGVATRYLASYLGWRRMIERDAAELSPARCMINALAQAAT